MLFFLHMIQVLCLHNGSEMEILKQANSIEVGSFQFKWGGVGVEKCLKVCHERNVVGKYVRNLLIFRY